MQGTRFFQSPAERWSGIGPYYAMMPTAFALRQIQRFTEQGDVVLDPFCGRGTVPFAAASLGRRFFGIEIFPVGWVYSRTKCEPAVEKPLLARLDEIAHLPASATETSEFFRAAYAPRVLSFLCAAREHLDWRHNRTDRTLMALILVSLHDKQGSGLSNQMRQTKAFHPAYALRWWSANGKATPPEVDPVEMIRSKISWRYRHGAPAPEASGKIYLGDCRRVLRTAHRISNVKLLFTSPPYYKVTNYYADQWLRNWMLGGPARPASGAHMCMKRFESKENYRSLLERTFTVAAPKLRRDSIVFVRIDAREYVLKTTKEVLRKVFPKKRLTTKASPLGERRTQTALFGDKEEKPGEVDIILQ